MKRPLLFSRLLQCSILLSFLLPFFFVGCEGGEKIEEQAQAIDSLTMDIVDTSASEEELKSLLFNNGPTFDSTSGTDSISTDKETATSDEENNELASIKVVEKYSWLKPFLYSIPEDPDLSGANFTGIGLIVNTMEYYAFISISFAFLLILCCLLSKFIDPAAVRTQLLHNILALLFLFTFAPSIIDHGALWGYWLCISLIATAIAVDGTRFLSDRQRLLQ